MKNDNFHNKDIFEGQKNYAYKIVNDNWETICNLMLNLDNPVLPAPNKVYKKVQEYFKKKNMEIQNCAVIGKSQKSINSYKKNKPIYDDSDEDRQDENSRKDGSQRSDVENFKKKSDRNMPKEEAPGNSNFLDANIGMTASMKVVNNERNVRQFEPISKKEYKALYHRPKSNKDNMISRNMQQESSQKDSLYDNNEQYGKENIS